MALFWLILAGIACFGACIEFSKDDMETKFDKLVDRIEGLENSVRSQNLVIQSQQDNMAAMKETINTQAKELKSQRNSITQLQDTTGKLRYDAKRLDRRVKTLESMITVPGTFHSAADVRLTNFDSASYDQNSTEFQEREWNAKLKSAIVDVEFDQSTDPQANQTRSVYKQARQTVPAIKDAVRRLLTPVQVTHVAFTAYLDKSLSHLGINHPIPFDKVMLNEGNAFNPHTGMFQCPQSGVYLFSFTIESHNAYVIVAKLVVDGNNQLDAITDGSGGHYQTASTTAIVRVTSGQSVWVATYHNNDVTLFDSDRFRYTSFSGVLLF